VKDLLPLQRFERDPVHPSKAGAYQTDAHPGDRTTDWC
jgi:hypothetical protein